MVCDEIKRALADFSACEQTEHGARIATHCLYPSFENVRVFVAKIGDGLSVHDGAGAHNTAWLHGRDEEIIAKSLNQAAERFHIFVAGKALVARIDNADWLAPAILTVANASSLAAHDAVDKIVTAQERALVEKIGQTLSEIVPPSHISKNVNVKGVSGGARHFDFIVDRDTPRPLYINSVTPRRNSIAAKYVSFADTLGDRHSKFAVHERELELGDTALLQQVASVVPLASLAQGARRSWADVTGRLR